MKLSLLLTILLAQCSNCAGILCSLAPDEPRGVVIAGADAEAQEVAPLAREEVVITSLPTGSTAMTVRRGGAEGIVASTPALFPYDLHPSVFDTERGWWLSRQGEEGVRSAVFFIVDDGEVRTTRVAVPRYARSVWLPIRGPEPRGVFVTVSEQPSMLRFDEVTPAGLRRLGAVPWLENGPERTLLHRRWSAQRLADGRIAVVTTDDPADEMTVKLHVFGGHEPVHATLPCASPIDHPIDTAVDASGRLALAGLTKDGRVAALLTSLDGLASARCRIISAPGERAAQTSSGAPSIVWTDEAFVAGWIRDDGTVRAAELRHTNAAPLIVDIARDAHVERPLRRLVYRSGENVVFTWRTRTGEVMHRSLPREIAGHAMVADLLRRLCAAFPQTIVLL